MGCFKMNYSTDFYSPILKKSGEIFHFEVKKYRYSFNGEERMDEMASEGNDYDLGARFYDDRLGKMFSLDPLMAKFPYWTPYSYSGNSPVYIIDENGEGPDPIRSLGMIASASFTLGNKNNFTSFGFNFAYCKQIGNFSQEYTFNFTANPFIKYNGIRRNNSSAIFYQVGGSAMFGNGSNNSLTGSGVVGGTQMYNPQGKDGFTGWGVGFKSIDIKGFNLQDLGNFSMYYIGRFPTKGGSMTVSIMEDFPFSDKGASGTMTATYNRPMGDGLSSTSYTNECYTDKSNGISAMAGTNIPSQNQISGRRYWTGMAHPGLVPTYGVNAITFGYTGGGFSGYAKVGLWGGKSGAGSQNFLHRDEIFNTPTFDHNTTYFGRPLYEIKLSLNPYKIE